jgi:hypothetical protein
MVFAGFGPRMSRHRYLQKAPSTGAFLFCLFSGSHHAGFAASRLNAASPSTGPGASKAYCGPAVLAIQQRTDTSLKVWNARPASGFIPGLSLRERLTHGHPVWSLGRRCLSAVHPLIVAPTSLDGKIIRQTHSKTVKSV